MVDNSTEEVTADEVPPDVEDPYADIDLSRLPSWWREAIEEFEAHGIRRYQPPRFSDDVLKYTVVERLESEHGIEIDFMGKNVKPGDEWTVRIDREPVGTIGRRRAAEAYTVFEMESHEFEAWIQERL